MENELAWKVIDHWKKNYESEEEALADLGNLDELALMTVEQIHIQGFAESDGIEYVAGMVESSLF